jgi:hypothetical protein
MQGYGLDSLGSGLTLVRLCEHGNKPYDFVKYCEFFEWLSLWPVAIPAPLLENYCSSEHDSDISLLTTSSVTEIDSL